MQMGTLACRCWQAFFLGQCANLKGLRKRFQKGDTHDSPGFSSQEKS